jgi:hypothetical protein
LVKIYILCVALTFYRFYGIFTFFKKKILVLLLGWRESFTQEVERLVQDLKHTHGLAPEQRSRRSISEQENLVRDHAGELSIT